MDTPTPRAQNDFNPLALDEAQAENLAGLIVDLLNNPELIWLAKFGTDQTTPALASPD